MEVTALTSVLHNMQESMNSSEYDIKKIREENAKQRQELHKKFSRLFPNVYISEGFLFELHRVMRECAACENCTGYPCQKKTVKGMHVLIQEEYGELTIRHYFCDYYKKAQEQSRATKQFNRAKIPRMYVGKTFEDYKVDAGNSNAIKGAKYVIEKETSLYLFGSPGTGKTFLAAIMAQEFLKKGKSVIFGDVPSLLDQLKGTFNEDSETKLDDLMDTLSGVDVLILDDLGTEVSTEWACERLYLIINSRYNEGKITIVTSNYAPEQAAARLNKPKNAKGEGITGSRIISRIRQMCKVVTIEGTDKRLRR